MKVETLTGIMAPCELGQTASHWKGQCFWAIYWQIAITTSVLCAVQLSTSRAKMSVSLHILSQIRHHPSMKKSRSLKEKEKDLND
jgi:hypothetical protein